MSQARTCCEGTPASHGGEAANVGEQNGGDALLAGQSDSVAIFPDFGGHVGGDVALEEAHELAALGFHAVFEAAFFDGTIAEAGGQGDEKRGFGGDEGQPEVQLEKKQNGDQKGASREKQRKRRCAIYQR